LAFIQLFNPDDKLILEFFDSFHEIIPFCLEFEAIEILKWVEIDQFKIRRDDCPAASRQYPHGADHFREVTKKL
jgi:hypothetical protein